MSRSTKRSTKGLLSYHGLPRPLGSTYSLLRVYLRSTKALRVYLRSTKGLLLT